MDVRIGIVVGERTDVNRDGSEPGRIIQAMITDPSDVQNVQTCQGGEEFNPTDGMQVIIAAGGSAYKIGLAFDDGIPAIMARGGKRIYATDPTGDHEVAEVRLHPDGKIELLNAEVAMTMQPDGSVTVENDNAGFTMSAAGQFTFHGTGSTFDHNVTVNGDITAHTVTGSTDVIAAGKSGKTHKHSGVTTGGGQTGVPV